MWLRLCGPYLIAEIIGIIFGYANIDIKCWYIPRLLENQPSQRWAACDDWIYRDKLAKSETTPETWSLLTRFNQSHIPKAWLQTLLPNTATPAALGSGHHAASLLQACHYVVMVTTAALLSYLWGGSGTRVWHGLYPILLITTLVQS